MVANMRDDGQRRLLDVPDVALVPLSTTDGFSLRGSAPVIGNAYGVTCGEEKVPLPATFSVELYPKVFKADPGSTSIEAAAYDVIFGYVSGAGHTCSGGSGQQFKGRFTVE